MNKKSLFAGGMLLLAAFIWGMAFVAQSKGMEYIGPLTYTCVRTLLAGVVLLAVACVMSARRSGAVFGWLANKKLIGSGLLCGLVLCASATSQQIGLVYTTAGKSGFITAMYIVLVPIMCVFSRRRPPAVTWVSVAVALGGLYLLCMGGGRFSLGKGDVWTMVCAIGFTLHIMIIDRVAPGLDGVQLSAMQFLVTGVITLPLMFIFETPRIGSIITAGWTIAYAGVLSGAFAFTLQIVAQKQLKPAVASLLMSFESVFAALGGWLLQGAGFSPVELVGCVLMFAAIMLTQLFGADGLLSARKKTL